MIAKLPGRSLLETECEGLRIIDGQKDIFTCPYNYLETAVGPRHPPSRYSGCEELQCQHDRGRGARRN